MAIQVINTAQQAFSVGSAVPVTMRLSASPEKYLVLAVALRSSGTPNITTVLWRPNGPGSATSQQSMTQLAVIQHPTQALRIEYWGLLAPTTSNTTTSCALVTPSGMVDGSAWLVGLSGVNQTTPFLGYPTVPPTALGSKSASTTATASTTVPTVSGDMVVQADAWDMQTALETFSSPSTSVYLGNVSSANATISARVRGGASLIRATGASTTFQTNIGNASIALNYTIAAIAFTPSTDNSPRYVDTNTTSLAVNTTLPTTPISVVSTTGFPAGAANPNSPSVIFGAASQSWGQNNLTTYYTGSTGTTFTGATQGNFALLLGAAGRETAGYGQGSTAASVVVIVPSTALLDDICIVNVQTFDTATAVANAGFTQISTQSVTGVAGASFKMVTFYRRIQAADLVNEASRTFTFTCGSNTRNATVSLYRGCIGAGTGAVGTNPVDAFATGSGQSQTTYTAPASTSTVNNTMVLSLFSFTFLSNTGKSAVNTINAERIAYQTMSVTDNVQLVAGAITGTRTWTGAGSDWVAATIILKPASGGATLIRNATRTTTAWTGTLSRAGSTWRRNAARAQVAISITVARTGSAIKRTLTRTTASISSTLSRQIRFNRHANYTRFGNSWTVRRQGSKWNRSLSLNLSPVTLILHRAGIGIHYLRSAAVTLSAGTVATLSRAGSTWRRNALRTGFFSGVASRILNAGPVTYIRNAVRTTASISIVLTRPGSRWKRTVSRTTASISSTVSRRVAFKRTLTRTTAAISILASRTAARARHASRTTVTISSTVSRAGTKWNKHATRTTTAFLAVVSRTITSGPQLYIRNAVRLTTTISSTVSRRTSTWRRNASRATATISSTVSRRAGFKRNASRTTISLTSTVSRAKSTYRRTLSRSTTSISIVVSRQVNGVSLSFFPFGTMPILRLYTAADFVGANVYFEANIKSSVTGQAGFARLFDVTAGGAVAGSQVTTSAPHDTAQRVRSGTLGLLNNHVYRAELGHNSGYTCSMSSADIVVELP